MADYEVLLGDCVASMRTLAGQSVDTCVTSPPYFGLRDYDHPDQIGLEPSPDAYVARLVEVFREVRRVLRDDGTLWLNLGDSYVGYHGNKNAAYTDAPSNRAGISRGSGRRTVGVGGLKNKDLIGIPWRVALRNRRSVWTVSTKPYRGAHFATFPPDLIEPCILAGSPLCGVVLDPFGGSGTTAGVAIKNGRRAVLCELNADYLPQMSERVCSIAGETRDLFLRPEAAS